MKNTGIFFILVALTLAGVQAQKQKKTHPIYGVQENLIKNPSNIWIHQVESTPVYPIQQQPSVKYIFDYPIIHSFRFNKKMGLNLISSLRDSVQYMVEATKKCVFLGKYAITFKKGKKEMTLLISSEPCDKMIIFCEGSPIDKKHIDLKEKSSIINAIEGLLKLQVQNENKQ